MWGSNFTGWSNGFCGWGPSFGHGPGFLGWLLPLLFWGVVAYLVFALISSLFSVKRPSRGDSAFDTLRHRFASGDINEQEYLAQKAVLSRK